MFLVPELDESGGSVVSWYGGSSFVAAVALSLLLLSFLRVLDAVESHIEISCSLHG